jgi:hypothetical protein
MRAMLMPLRHARNVPAERTGERALEGSGPELSASDSATAGGLRARAFHIRLLARELINAEDRGRLLDYAQELEDRATAADAEGGT